VFQEASRKSGVGDPRSGTGAPASQSMGGASGGSGSFPSPSQREGEKEAMGTFSSDRPDRDAEASPSTEQSARFAPSASFRVRRLRPEYRDIPGTSAFGRRTTSVGDGQGRYARARLPANGLKSIVDLAFDATAGPAIGAIGRSFAAHHGN
jgi:hypothetical protein